MWRIELMPWEQARAYATPIRFAVFVAEQGVPAGIEMDEMDAKCVHAIAFEGDHAVATGRLLPDSHIGRMAVLEEFRGKGVGGAVLAKLMEAAKSRGDREVLLSAQVHAVPFYEAYGFEVFGEVYEEAGIPHRDMRRDL
jgi:predicted GNAT family N-acyltransferase